MGSILGSRALHGNMQQFQRDKTIAAFRDGRFNVLVATDVAARGLDIPNVDLVIEFVTIFGVLTIVIIIISFFSSIPTSTEHFLTLNLCAGHSL